MDKLFTQIVNLTDELFSFVDTQYRYQEVNDAYLRLFHTKRDDYIGKHVSALMGWEQFLEIKSFLDRSFAGEHVSYEKWFELNHGKRYYFFVAYTPYVSEDTIIGTIVSIKNYTQQKLLEEEKVRHKELLLHYAKMAELGSMASFLNHQWRAPLNTLGANFLKLQVLSRAHENTAPLQEGIARCEEIVEQISQDLERFRDFYNPSSVREVIRVEESIKQVLSFLDDRINRYDVALGQHIVHHSEIKGRKSDLMHLLMIFFNNALDAFERNTINNPMLDITLKERNGRVTITIEDNAGGIEEDILKQIFVNFVSTKGYTDGTGMGLFFAKMVAQEKLNARLRLKNGPYGLKVILDIPQQNTLPKENV